MRPPRGPMAPGPAAVLLAVVLATPAVLRRCKPFAKTLGDLLVKAGTEVHRIAGTEDEPEAPKGDVSEQTTDQSPSEESTATDTPQNETTKVGAGTEEVALETASPIGHEEISEQIAAEAKGDGAVPEPITPAPQKEDKPLEPDQTRNPKREQNARPD